METKRSAAKKKKLSQTERQELYKKVLKELKEIMAANDAEVSEKTGS